MSALKTNFCEGINWGTIFWTFSLAPLVSKVKEPQVEVMVDILCTNMTSDKEQLRDISSMGLKAVIAELPLSASGEGWLALLSCTPEEPIKS